MAKKINIDNPKSYEPKTTLLIVGRLNELAKITETSNEFLYEVGSYCTKLMNKVIEPALKKRGK